MKLITLLITISRIYKGQRVAQRWRSSL